MNNKIDRRIPLKKSPRLQERRKRISPAVLNYMAISCDNDFSKNCGSDGVYCETCPYKKPLEYYTITTNVWVCCPKCKGQGIVSKPSYIAGDVLQWNAGDATFKCDVCKGKKILNNITGLPPK